ncbi:photosynthetic NDH subunit of subcomplex B 3, chloroplastic [Dendrobium catenatum]|uniref:photosynthetic NDH subunit of subcomplex B 3, chloroplastic n=1 Tax=Dendrobium catenatum TaxID=906689 RepID=UPI00109FDBBC|nr:photosynthetic NDH subunit of subcomplex B 3, chloroplastic [Dendrobium catenatum]
MNICTLLQLNSHLISQSCFLRLPLQKKQTNLLLFPRLRRLCAAEKVAAGEQEEPPSMDFAFVSPRLLPDGTPDIGIRSAASGKSLRDIMLDAYIDLYGPYDAPLSNCAGFGTCGTCLVEVVEGTKLLSSRTDKEKERKLQKPRTWRLACQTTVGDKDSRGQVSVLNYNKIVHLNPIYSLKKNLIGLMSVYILAGCNSCGKK